MALSRLDHYRAAIVSHVKSWHFIGSLVCLAAAFVGMMVAKVDLQWFWMLLFAVTTVPFAPWARDPVLFFRGGFVSDTSKHASNWLVLTSSAFVSWIFAKGILNTSTLGASFGVVGGLAYASW